MTAQPRPQLYIVRGRDGPEAIHQGTETPDRKTFTWCLGPDGRRRAMHFNSCSISMAG